MNVQNVDVEIFNAFLYFESHLVNSMALTEHVIFSRDRYPSLIVQNASFIDVVEFVRAQDVFMHMSLMQYLGQRMVTLIKQWIMLN